MLPRSHRDTARKAFEKVTKRTLPSSHRELAGRSSARRASTATGSPRLEQQARAAAAAATDEAGEEPDAGPIDDVDDRELSDEDLEEPQAA